MQEKEMKNVQLKNNIWAYALLLPLVTITVSLILSNTQMPAIQFVQATVWGLGLILLALAVNIDNRSALPLVVLGLILPTLAVVNLFAQAVLMPLTIIVAISLLGFAIWQGWRKGEKNRSRSARVVPIESRKNTSAHVVDDVNEQMQILRARTG